MNVSKRLPAATLACLTLALAGGQELVGAQLTLRSGGPGRMEARIWMDRGVDPVFEQGDRVRVYYRSSDDAYVAILHVDTDGALRLVLPSGPDDQLHQVRGGSDYRLIPTASEGWLVEGEPGVGYFFILASERPFYFGWLAEGDAGRQWALSGAGVRIGQDPYVSVDGLMRLFLPNAERLELALDFTAYHVEQTFSFPRFLCYQCHEPVPFAAWNPYEQACPLVQVVIFNDPYFYPVTRYQGSRVAYPNPPFPGLPQFAFRERFPGEAGTPDVRARVGPMAPFVLSRAQLGQAIDATAEMLNLLEQAGAVAPGSTPTGLATPRFDGISPGVLDAGPPSLLDPASGNQDDRPVLQRRVNQQGDPQP